MSWAARFPDTFQKYASPPLMQTFLRWMGHCLLRVYVSSPSLANTSQLVHAHWCPGPSTPSHGRPLQWRTARYGHRVAGSIYQWGEASLPSQLALERLWWPSLGLLNLSVRVGVSWIYRKSSMAAFSLGDSDLWPVSVPSRSTAEGVSSVRLSAGSRCNSSCRTGGAP